jgi:6-methylsalicylate decarboxylase
MCALLNARCSRWTVREIVRRWAHEEQPRPQMTMAQHEPGLGSGAHIASGRIDVHAHYVPAGLQASLPAAPIFRGFASWEPRAALEVMDRQGIATAILSMVIWTGMFAAAVDAAAARRVARSSNEAAAEAIRSHPGRFGGFARLPLPDADAALAEIDYALGTLRLDGVVLLTNHDGVYLGDSRLDPVFDELNRRKAVVFLHPALPAGFEQTSLGYAPSLIEFVFDTTRAVTHLVLSGTLERCPGLRLIVPHAGGTIPFLVDRISLLAARFVPGTATRAQPAWKPTSRGCTTNSRSRRIRTLLPRSCSSSGRSACCTAATGQPWTRPTSRA